MESNKLSLEEVIQLAGRVKGWERLPHKNLKIEISGYNGFGRYTKIESYEGIVENLQITVAHNHHEQKLCKLSPIKILGVNPFSVDSAIFESFEVSATLRSINLGRYNSHQDPNLYFRPALLDGEGALKAFYNHVKATYNQQQKERQERAERYTLREARALL